MDVSGQRRSFAQVAPAAPVLQAAAITPPVAAAAPTPLVEGAAAPLRPAAMLDLLRPRVWQYAGLGLAMLAVSPVWGAGGSVLLSQQVEALVGDAGKGAALGMVTGAAAFVSMVAAPIFGVLSDRVGRLKPFVFATSLGVALPMILMLLFPTWSMIIVAQAITGIVFGMYLSVDQALMFPVPPNMEHAARDLGILNSPMPDRRRSRLLQPASSSPCWSAIPRSLSFLVSSPCSVRSLYARSDR